MMSNIGVMVTVKPVGPGASLGGSDAADALAKGREYGELLLRNDEKREKVILEVYENCDPCEGSGEKPKKKRTRKERETWPPPSCERCEGMGRITLEVVEMKREDLPAKEQA